ncbi:antitoxin [Streptomyces sp. NPDC005573]|uniref:antitoxin n=1 Tax=unclassified Streptomyces TaxID=2593676 RepID=UPI0033B81A26
MFDNLKNLKDKAEDIAEEHGDQISDGLEKLGDVVDERTGGKHSGAIDTAVDKAQEYVEKLGEREGDERGK